jgi:lipooligosaccharide transport system ATP-binding protein
MAVGLTKRYRDVVAVDRIDFVVRERECFGFLGPNGAGKTTTVKMASCFIEPTEGRLTVLGDEVRAAPRRIKARLGVCPQESNLDPDLTVFDNLRVFARYFDIVGAEARRRSEELLDFVGLGSKRGVSIDELSGGMRRRLLIARALLNRPRILILDEPTTGLDPQARHQIWETVTQLKREEGTSVLLTTHYMDEAQHLCDRLVIMDKGRVLLEGRPRDLVAQEVGVHVIEIAASNESLSAYLKSRGLDFETTATHTYVTVKDGEAEFRQIASRVEPGACVLRSACLEDVFLKVTGRGLRE